jgi:predicted nuclease with TOPRIM domain
LRLGTANTVLGSEDNTAVLTAQIQELRNTTEALKNADEQKDANVNALRDEIKQLKATVAEAHNNTVLNSQKLAVIDSKVGSLKQLQDRGWTEG